MAKSAFQELWDTVETLLGPKGCPWDLEQTLKSSRSYIIEESSELVEAIDLEDNEHIREELGDLFFIVVFLCKLAEKEKRTHLDEVIHGVNEKLIRRHPHVFGDVTIESSDQVIKQWSEIKRGEKGKAHLKSALDSIPKGLPALARAQKVYKKLKDTHFPGLPQPNSKTTIQDEDSLGKILFELVSQAQKQGLDAEHALRKTLLTLETSYREFEAQKT